MVDSVTIVNDSWARERTLLELLSETKIGNSVLETFVKENLGKEQVEAAKKQVDATKDGFESLSESADTTPVVRSLSRTTSAIDLMKKELSSSFEQIGNQLSSADPRSMFNAFSSNLKYTSRYLEDVGGTLPKFLTALTKVSAIVALSYERLTDLNDAYVASYSAGVRFADGIDGLNKAVGESGMTVQEFTGLMNRYSQTFNVLGGKDAVRLSKEFKKITNSGSDLLMTQTESQDALMSYADMLRMSGRLGRTSAQDIAQGGKGFLESINELSEVSGRSREEILRSTRDAIAQPSFQSFLAGLDDVAQANLEKGVASLAAFGADIQNEYKDMVVAASTGGVAAMYKTNTNLMQLAQTTGQLPKLMRVIELAKAGQDTTQAMKEFYEGIKNNRQMTVEQINQLAQFNPMFAGMRDEFGKLGVATNSLADLEKQARDRGFESVKAMRDADTARSKALMEADTEMKTAMTSLNSAFNDLIIHTVYPILIPAIKLMATALNTVTWPLQKFGDMLSGMHDMLGGGDVAGLATAGVGLAGGYLGWKGVKAIPGMLGGMGRGMMGKMGLGLPAGPEIPGLDDMAGSLDRKMGKFGSIADVADKAIRRVGTLGKGVGEFIGSIGKGLGTAIGGLIEMTMKGLAAGLSAFAQGAVIAGAASLAGSIALIGSAVDLIIGGFGLAMMAIGKGLDMVGDSLIKFNDIDGANLGEVGKGMVLLGAGMAAMGVGEVVSAWGSIVDGVMSWFKADVKTKLLDYASIGEPMKEAGEGLNAFATSFMSAINMLNNASLADSVGSTFDQLKGFLGTDMGGFFGGAPAVVGQIDSLAESIGNLAQKTLEFQNAQAGAAVTLNPSMPAITTADLQKRTLLYYDDQKQSNASMIALLQTANDKLDDLNETIDMQTTDLGRAIRSASGSL